MKRYVTYVLLVVALSLVTQPCLGQSTVQQPRASDLLAEHLCGVVTEGFQACAWMERDALPSGAPVEVHLAVINASTEGLVFLVRHGIYSSYELMVLNSRGEEARLTKRGHKQFDGFGSGSRIFFTLEAGAAYEVNPIPVSSLFDLSEPGIYRITVAWRVLQRGSVETEVLLEANPVYVTVLPPGFPEQPVESETSRGAR